MEEQKRNGIRVAHCTNKNGNVMLYLYCKIKTD